MAAQLTNQEIWHLVQTWVRSNRVLIWCIAAPYYRQMSCSPQDVKSEALLTGYQVMSNLLKAGKGLDLMDRYFWVVFRAQCLRMAEKLWVVDLEIDRIQVTGEQRQEELDQDVVDSALLALTDRQRQISEWILSQPTPVNTRAVGQNFGIQKRAVRILLGNAINRIENYGHQQVRGAIPATS